MPIRVYAIGFAIVAVALGTIGAWARNTDEKRSLRSRLAARKASKSFDWNWSLILPGHPEYLSEPFDGLSLARQIAERGNVAVVTDDFDHLVEVAPDNAAEIHGQMAWGGARFIALPSDL